MGDYVMVGLLGGVLFIIGAVLIYNRWANAKVNKEFRNARFMKGSMLGRRPYEEDEDD